MFCFSRVNSVFVRVDSLKLLRGRWQRPVFRWPPAATCHLQVRRPWRRPEPRPTKILKIIQKNVINTRTWQDEMPPFFFFTPPPPRHENKVFFFFFEKKGGLFQWTTKRSDKTGPNLPKQQKKRKKGRGGGRAWNRKEKLGNGNEKKN